MKTYTFSNGCRLIHVPRQSSTCTVLVNVAAGSNNESDKIQGISHYIEHMLFEGTKKRPDSYIISNEIERLGGEFNAATSNERTYYYIKVASQHFGTALDVLSDITCNPLFGPGLLEKEKGIIADEIKLVTDQPRFYQWIFFQQKLYKKHPARRPIYGSIESVNAINRQNILDYYQKHYVGKNITVVVVGDTDNVKARVGKAFSSLAAGKPTFLPAYKEPAQKNESFEEKRNTAQAYMIQGYKTPPRNHKDSYALDVIRAILGRGQSGKIFNEVRNKRGLAYDVGVLHNPSTDFGFFAVYVNTHRENVEKVREIISDEIRKLSSVTDIELEEAKTFLEGEFLLQSDDTQRYADMIAFWAQCGKAADAQEYVDRIRGVDRNHVIAVSRLYLGPSVTTILS